MSMKDKAFAVIYCVILFFTVGCVILGCGNERRPMNESDVPREFRTAPKGKETPVSNKKKGDKETQDKIVLQHNKRGKVYWTLKSMNGRVLAVSEEYEAYDNAWDTVVSLVGRHPNMIILDLIQHRTLENKG